MIRFGHDLLRKLKIRQSPTGHATRCDFSQRFANALRHKRHRARGAGINFQNENIIALYSHLHIHQAHHLQLHRNVFYLLADDVLNMHWQVVGRQGARRIAGMHTGLLNMLHDRTDNYLLAIADSIHVYLYSLVQIAIKQHRSVVRHVHCRLHVLTELIVVINDFHRPTSKNIRGPDNNRVANFRRPRQALL